jgi:hypothetical protein
MVETVLLMRRLFTVVEECVDHQAGGSESSPLPRECNFGFDGFKVHGFPLGRSSRRRRRAYYI